MPPHLSTGLTYRPPIPGMVPEYEEREAAHASGQTWGEYVASDRDERAATVAWYRTRRLVDLHIDQVVNSERKAQQRRAEHARRTGA